MVDPQHFLCYGVYGPKIKSNKDNYSVYSLIVYYCSTRVTVVLGVNLIHDCMRTS